MKSISSVKTRRAPAPHPSYDEPRAYDAYGIFFETLANQNRLRIINSLRAGPKNVSGIIDATGLEQTCVSHCLKRLEGCGFVSAARDGKYRVYTLNTKTIGPLMRLIDTHTSTYCVHLLGGESCAHHAAGKAARGPAKRTEARP